MLNTYSIHWDSFGLKNHLKGCAPNKYPTSLVGPSEMLTKVLENTPHFVVFIVTKDQVNFDETYKSYNWERFLYHTPKGLLWNPNYPAPQGVPRLKLVILKGTGKDET